MFKEVTKDVFYGLIATTRVLQMVEMPETIDLVCHVFNCQSRYFVYVKNKQIVISYIAFTKNQKIYAPIHFFYTPLWLNTQLSELKQHEYLTEFIKELTHNFHHISIRLAPGYTDIRPFLWNNFKTINNYTYIKYLSDLTYSSSFQRNIKKIKLTDYQFVIENITPSSDDLNMKVFENLGTVRKKRMLQIRELMRGMNDSGLLTCFNCYDNEVLLASAQVFLDKNSKIAYLILLSQTDKSKKYNIHSVLHHFMFNSLQEMDYLQFDLMGADLKNISNFKSSTHASLIPHFTLTYNKNEAFWKLMKEKLINFLKRIIVKIN